MITIAYSPVKREALAQNIVEMALTSEDGHETIDVRLTWQEWDDDAEVCVARLIVETLGSQKITPFPQTDGTKAVLDFGQ